jgi:hypothetical protein
VNRPHKVHHKTVMKAFSVPGEYELIGVGITAECDRPGHPIGVSPAFWEFVVVGCEIMVDENTGLRIHDLLLTPERVWRDIPRRYFTNSNSFSANCRFPRAMLAS